MTSEKLYKTEPPRRITPLENYNEATKSPFTNLPTATILGVRIVLENHHPLGLIMVHTCVVAGCRNRRIPGTSLSFYRFPRDPDRKQRWIAAVNREGWLPNDGSRLCSTHFISGAQPTDSKDRGGKPGKRSAAEPDNYEDVLKILKKENRALRESVDKMSLSETSFRNDPEKVRFYTGLPNYFVFETVMWLLAPHMNGTKNMVKLSMFQQLLLTLMRLRLDLKNQDLAYRFGVKVGTVTRTVLRMVNVMSTTLVPTAVFWPSRAELRKNLPAALHSTYPDCAVIIDCFRTHLNIDCSGETGASAGSNTLKYMIGMAPQGVVTFVSRGSPGSVSDKSLAEGCGFLGKLLPGDVVLADKDLDIGESVAAHGALLKITGCDGGEGSEGSEDVSLTDISPERLSVRRHVERVVSMVKLRYSMLTGPVEVPFTAAERSSNIFTFDKIVQVACALNNLCISAAPLE
uniref:THAP-type domain-containing protein n=1 Tax=Oncorhynchus kisutch TaxID=8019 RepID=A0A8C7MD68_ONCKI